MTDGRGRAPARALLRIRTFEPLAPDEEDDVRAEGERLIAFQGPGVARSEVEIVPWGRPRSS